MMWYTKIGQQIFILFWNKESLPSFKLFFKNKNIQGFSMYEFKISLVSTLTN